MPKNFMKYPHRSPRQTLEQISGLLDRLDPSCGYTEWLAILMAVHHETDGSEEPYRGGRLRYMLRDETSLTQPHVAVQAR